KAGFKAIEFVYRELQDVGAAALFRTNPTAVLVDENWRSRERAKDQSPLTPVRFAMALRQMNCRVGSEKLSPLLSSFASTPRFAYAKDFYDSIDRADHLTKKEREDLQEDLRQWLTKPGWADLVMNELKTRRLPSGQWESQITYTQEGN